jgi:hypothetical protein
MALALRGLAVLACAAALHSQTGNPAPAQPPAGLETEWDISVVLGEMAAHAGRLLAAVDRADAKAWAQKGASETYTEQLDSCKRQITAFQDGAKALASDPERLAAALELLFRIEGVDTMLGSIEEGIRKYQSPEDAQALAALAAENGTNLGRFQKYIVDLAADREKQFVVMDREAQRCRGVLANQPSAGPSTPGRKK